MDEPVLTANDIMKRYGNVEALRGVDFAAEAGRVVGLIGDNGAGKSTLVKILSGTEQPDSGEIRVGGRPVSLASPVSARRLGLSTVYQDLALAPDLDAAGNLFLGLEEYRRGLLGRLGWLDDAGMRRQARQVFDRLGVSIKDMSAPVATYSGGQRQAVAVARAATWASKLLLLDEPTAALGVVQTRQVLDLIRSVRDSGVAVVLVSHNMPDVLAVCDQVTVLRLGRQVGHFDARTVDGQQLVAAMTGADAASPRTGALR